MNFRSLSSRLPSSLSESQKEILKELSLKSPTSKDGTPTEVQKVIANNIDEGAWFVCNKVWQLLENPVDESNELAIKERLADIQVIDFFRIAINSSIKP